MPTRFDEKKANILTQLSASDDAYSDLSPKGSVDQGVRELCSEINALDGFVTTSSCAGRIAVYLDGLQKIANDDDESNDAPPTAPSGGKGGGEWLYVSHDPIELSNMQDGGSLFKLFDMDPNSTSSSPLKVNGTRFVHFRFEPMILHILTSSLQHAHQAHSSGLTSGFRESGISSVSGPTATPIVAIRTQGLFLSSIIGWHDASSDAIKPMVTESYLRALVELANTRFIANEQRKQRFRRALLKLDSQQGAGVTNAEWEPAAERRERKRAEGLRRKEELRRREAANVNSRASGDELDHGEDYSLVLDPGPLQP